MDDLEPIVDPGLAPVAVSARPDRTLAVTRGVCRVLSSLGHVWLLEVSLRNGRRADVLSIGPRGEIFIVEVKSSLEDYLSDSKWLEYGPFSDRFYFAVDMDFPKDVIPQACGLILADGFGGAVVRESPLTPLAPARRKALTLMLARLGAARAMTMAPPNATVPPTDETI